MNDKKTSPSRRTPRATRTLPAADQESNRRAALILEVLAGARSAGQAAEALKICTNHYYLLERKALAGLLAACQPQPRGKRPAAEGQLAALQRDLARCQLECQRQAALVRALQRTVGLPASPPPEKPKTRSAKSEKNGSARKRHRRASVRALRMAKEFNERATVAEAVAATAATPPDNGSTERARSQKEQPDGT